MNLKHILKSLNVKLFVIDTQIPAAVWVCLRQIQHQNVCLDGFAETFCRLNDFSWFEFDRLTLHTKNNFRYDFDILTNSY